MANTIDPNASNNVAATLIPRFYRTPANKKFLLATVEQLTQPGTVTKINGYIGRQNSKASTGNDVFVKAADQTRQDYQLEPSLVINDQHGNNIFFKDYQDYINRIEVLGGNVENHARLNKEEFYSWYPHIDWDKFVNFQNYYWLPGGPDVISIPDISTNALGKVSYLSTTDVQLSNGMLVVFSDSIVKYYVEGVGSSITLLPYSNYQISYYTVTAGLFVVGESYRIVTLGDTDFTTIGASRNAIGIVFTATNQGIGTGTAAQKITTPDYLVINRGSIDQNPWSIGNRWFHSDVISTSSAINGTTPSLDSATRATRPILEFEANLNIFNFGTKNATIVTFIDDFTTDVFSTIEGSVGYNINGIQVAVNDVILFTADTDPLVKNNIYRVSIVDALLHLTLVSSPIVNQVLMTGTTIGQGTYYWYNGTMWALSQQKTTNNQAPLFDVVDANGESFSNGSVYSGTTFAGTKLFSYGIGNGSNDTVLGFPLAYQNFNNIGDIVFSFNYSVDTFDYTEGMNVITKAINVGFLSQATDQEIIYSNDWQTCVTNTVQAAVRIYKNSGIKNDFYIDIFDNIKALSDLEVRVYVNGIRLPTADWSIVDTLQYKQLHLVSDITQADILTIRAFAAQPINSNGFYEIPNNLQNNPQNGLISQFTLSAVFDHVNSIVDNLPTKFIGTYPGSGNLRDLGNITPYGVKFIQHSGPASVSMYHMTSGANNVIRAIEHSGDAYNKFKRKFITVAENLGVDTDVRNQVDLILQQINRNTPITAPYYFSDMVAYGASNVTTITVVDNLITYYPLSDIFTLDTLSTKAVSVYLNDVQLLARHDYAFTNSGFIDITIPFNNGDIILICEYENTNGCFVPETPTKLGMWPSFDPKLYLDTTLVTPVNMIQGHDGSQVLAYNDYRDDLILELETRIYNNIKVAYKADIFDINTVLPLYNTTTDYSITEFNPILSASFYKWTSLIGVSFADVIGYDQSNSFTYNYVGFSTPDGRDVPGYWRGIYRWMLGTDRPHVSPWEMLGIYDKPTWWDLQYGVAPYTSDNLRMWRDISNGCVNKPGQPVQIIEAYIRPYLMSHLPVDEYGNLISPLESGLASGLITPSISNSFVFGDVNPVESAWRRSSHYPFSVISAATLMAPSKTLGTLFDVSRITRNLAGQLINTTTGLRLTTNDVVLPSIYNSTTVVQTSGIINYLINYITSADLTSYNSYAYDIANMNFNLSYRLGAFTSKEQVNLILDYTAPLSSSSMFIPNEDYSVVLNNSSPTKKLSYSGVIITKLVNGYSVTGYSKTQPYFVYYDWLQSGNIVTIGGISESFVTWAPGQQYFIGQVVLNGSIYYRAKVLTTRSNTFIESEFQSLASLPIVGGRTATFRKTWNKITPLTIPYNTTLATIQDVVDFLTGYGQWLTDQGFEFDEFNSETNQVNNWQTSAKEFLFWTTQNWSAGQDIWSTWAPNTLVEFNSIVQYNGDYYQAIRNVPASPTFDYDSYFALDGLSNIGSSVISLSPAAGKLSFSTPVNIVDDITNPYNDYEMFKVDGQAIQPSALDSDRDENLVSYSTNNTDGIYNASFYLVQMEHVVIINNTTAFNDLIYNPVSGYKQDRIKLSAYISTGWYGGLDIPGFIYDNVVIQQWAPWVDYALSDVVQYQTAYYSADLFISGSDIFSPEYWTLLAKKPSSKILPNWTNIATQFVDFYSLDVDGFNTDQQTMARHLIGYQKRQYLDNIIQNDVSEFKFYQGMIADKGTQNVLNKLFGVLDNDNEVSLTFYEEWAVRVGQYGACSAFDEIEFIIDQSLAVNNPQGYQLGDTVDAAVNQYIIQQTPNDIYLKPSGYDSKPFPINATPKQQLRSAGYVRPFDVNTVLHDISQITDSDITAFVDGDYIWCTFEGTTWNVYRYSATDITVSDITYANNQLTITSSITAGAFIIGNGYVITDIGSTDFAEIGASTNTVGTSFIATASGSGSGTAASIIPYVIGSYIGITGVSSLAGFYVVDSVSVGSMIIAAPNMVIESPFTQQSYVGLYEITSQRATSIDAITNTLPTVLKENEIVWTDDNGTGKWSTWTNKSVYSGISIPNPYKELKTNYGRAVGSDAINKMMAIATTIGSIYVYKSNGNGRTLVQTISRPFISNIDQNPLSSFGTTVVMSDDGTWLAIGSPMVSFAATFKTESNFHFDNTGLTFDSDVLTFDNTSDGSITIDFSITNPNSNNSTLLQQGTISLYKKSSADVYFLVNTYTSPFPQNNEYFGYTMEFGTNVLYIGAPGSGTVYEMDYNTKIAATTSYNVIGSNGTTVKVSSTFGVENGMFVIGSGFSSGQSVVDILDEYTVIVDVQPDIQPSGLLDFVTYQWQYDIENTLSGPIGYFGAHIAVSTDGNTVVTSASGSVYVYFKDVLIQIIHGQTSDFGDAITVSDNGSYIAISDKMAPTQHVKNGTVTIYEKINTQYVQYQVIDNIFLAPVNRFATALEFMNNYSTLVIYSGDTMTQSSSIDVYDRYANDWVYSEKIAPLVYAAGSFIIGNSYIILSIGTTDFVDIGAASNSIGITFIATGVGLGTGTASVELGNTMVFTAGNFTVGNSYTIDFLGSTDFTTIGAIMNAPGVTFVASGSGYGSGTASLNIGFSVGSNIILVGEPSDVDQYNVAKQYSMSGLVFEYKKPLNSYSWSILHEETEKPNIDKIKKVFLHDKKTNAFVSYLDHVDPLQGKIPGPAAAELTYRTFYDPAVYSVPAAAGTFIIGSSYTISSIGNTDFTAIGATSNIVGVLFIATDIGSGTGTATDVNTNINPGNAWMSNQVGLTWWDLRTAKFVECFDTDAVYRTSNWNVLSHGASIDVYEWVSSASLPEYWDTQADTPAGLAVGISGTSLYGNSVYSVQSTFDNVSKTIKYTYYFWVKNKTVVPNINGRHISSASVANLITNPLHNGYQYVAFTGGSSFELANIGALLRNTDVVLSIQYWLIDNIKQGVHAQWKMISNDPSTNLPSAIEQKWFDSLCGVDVDGRLVPDISLPPKLLYGVENRPRQGMFVNRFEALKQYIEQANLILREKQITTTRDLSTLELYDKTPEITSNLYDIAVDTEVELSFVNASMFKQPILSPVITDGRITSVSVIFGGVGYITPPNVVIFGNGVNAIITTNINTKGQITDCNIENSGEGYIDSTTLTVRTFSALVKSDSSANGSWVVYSYANNIWNKAFVQSYNTNNYWSYIDWYAVGYSNITSADYAVDIFDDIQYLDVVPGDIVKIRMSSFGDWALLLITNPMPSLQYVVIGIQNGTIQLSSSLYIVADYDAAFYDVGGFDNYPTVELRNVLIAIRDDIFINELVGDYLNLFFTGVRYAFSEQTYIDWIFKTSFVKAQHKVGGLNQTVTYSNDNLDDFEKYVSEVKPYRTKVREYVSVYQKMDIGSIGTCDFDLPAVYETGGSHVINTIVENGIIVADDIAIQSYPWKSWLDHVGFVVTEFALFNNGSGYTSTPTVTITSDSGHGATAKVTISNGQVSSIVMLTPGSGYLSAPLVTISSPTNGIVAQAIAVIGNGVVRTNRVALKFDRITNDYLTISLDETENFVGTGFQNTFDLTWTPDIRIGQTSISINGISALRGTYSINQVVFKSKSVKHADIWTSIGSTNTQDFPTENVIFMSPQGNDNNDGTTISDPKKTLLAAFNSAIYGTTIVIFGGSYITPTPMIIPDGIIIIMADGASLEVGNVVFGSWTASTPTNAPEIPAGPAIFIAPQGNDVNSGTSITNPKLTLSAALAAATSGVTVVVFGGSFIASSPIIIPTGVILKVDGAILSIITPYVDLYTTEYYGNIIFDTPPPSGSTIVVNYHKDITVLNAADRIKFFYNPQVGDLGKSLPQLMTGIEYGGVVVDGLSFDVSMGWGSLPYGTDRWGFYDPNFTDYSVTVAGGVHSITLPYIPATGTFITVYKNDVRIDDQCYGSPQQINIYAEMLTPMVGGLSTPGTWLTTVPSDTLSFPTENVIFIAPQGSDGNSGTTVQEPKLTLDGALATAMYGTIIVIFGGSYVAPSPTTIPDGVIVMVSDGASLVVSTGATGSWSSIGDIELSSLPVDGVMYISPQGNDDNVGTSITEPKLTLAAAISSSIGGMIIVIFGGTFSAPSPTTIPNGIVVMVSNGAALAVGPLTTEVTIGIDGSVTINIPSTVVINNNDVITLREITSDGSITLHPADYDTVYDGGNLAYSTANGYEPGAIIVDGDDFIIPMTSPSPEELVMGQVVDSVSITVIAQPYVGNWITDVPTNSSGLPTENVLFITPQGNDSNSGTTLANSKLTLLAAIDAAVAGTTIVVFGGTYSTPSPTVIPDGIIVMIANGAQLGAQSPSGLWTSDIPSGTSGYPTENVIFVAPQGNDINSGTSVSQPKFTLSSALSDAGVGTTVVIFGGFFTAPSPTTIPDGVIVMVEDGAGLDIGVSAVDTWSKIGSLDISTITTTDIIFMAPHGNDSNTGALDSPKLSLTYILEHIIADTTIVIFGGAFMAPSPTDIPDGVCIMIADGASLGVTPMNTIDMIGHWTSAVPTDNQDFPTDNVIFISPQGNDSNDGATTVTAKLTLAAALDVATIGFTIVVFGGIYSAPSPTIIPDGVVLMVATGAVLEVVAGGASYQQFKDMLNRTHYKNFDTSKGTQLVNALHWNDSIITVVDTSVLDEPNAQLNKPGIIQIGGERIEYFTIVGNTLGQLRRATLGTGSSAVYAIGAAVQNIGASQTVAYSDNTVSQQVTIIAPDVNLINIDFVPRKSNVIWTHPSTFVSSIPANYGQTDDIEVFIGGYDISPWTVNTPYNIGDIINVGISTYRCIFEHTSNLDFKTDISNWAFFISNARLKKQPYVAHNENIAPYSPAGDVNFDADFSVDGVSKQIRLTNQLPIGTIVTVIKRTGAVWHNQYTV